MGEGRTRLQRGTRGRGLTVYSDIQSFGSVSRRGRERGEGTAAGSPSSSVTATGMGGASLALETGARRAKWNLLLQMSKGAELSGRPRPPRTPARTLRPARRGHAWEGSSPALSGSATSQPLAPSCLPPPPASIPEKSRSEGKHEESGEGRVLPAPHQVPPLQLEVCSVAFLHLDEDSVAGGLPGHVLVPSKS